MATRVQRWGNGLGVRIPRVTAEKVGLKEGMEVEFSLMAGGLTIRPRRRRRRKYKLADLLAKIKPNQRHGEVYKDGPRGREMI